MNAACDDRPRVDTPRVMDDADRRRAFDALWAAHADAVYGYARRRADEEPARDALAETFTVAWRRIDELPGDAALPWLLGTCRRVLANQRRGEGRRRRLADRLRGLAPDALPGLADGSAEAAAVRAAFLDLSARDREALALIAWDGLSPAQAAAVCGCSATAFTTRLHRARRRMAAALAATDAPAPVPAMEEERT